MSAQDAIYTVVRAVSILSDIDAEFASLDSTNINDIRYIRNKRGRFLRAGHVYADRSELAKNKDVKNAIDVLLENKLVEVVRDTKGDLNWLIIRHDFYTKALRKIGQHS